MPSKPNTLSEHDTEETTSIEVHEDVPVNWPGAVTNVAQCAALAVCIYFFTTCTARIYEADASKHNADHAGPETAVPGDRR